MTRFTGPLKVKKAFSEVTVASIDASGSAKFTQGLSMGGALVVAGASTVSGASTLHGRVQVGEVATRGDIVLVQQSRVSATTTKVTAAVLPDGADVLDIKLFVETPFGASALTDIDLLVGTSAHDTRFARFTNVTAQGYYTVTDRTQTSAWTNVSGANANVIIQVTAVSGAVASTASGILSIMYVAKQ